MNTEYLWWLLALVLAGGGTVAFLALGRVPEIEDETAAEDGTAADGTAAEDVPQVENGPAEEATPPASVDPLAGGPGSPQSSPVSTSVPGPDAPSWTSETP